MRRNECAGERAWVCCSYTTKYHLFTQSGEVVQLCNLLLLVIFIVRFKKRAMLINFVRGSDADVLVLVLVLLFLTCLLSQKCRSGGPEWCLCRRREDRRFGCVFTSVFAPPFLLALYKSC
jgi:hypothetical protein